MRIVIWVLAAVVCFTAGPDALSQETPLHGLWVWKTPTLLDLPARGEALRDFCRSHQINEVYLSFSSQNGGSPENSWSLQTTGSGERNACSTVGSMAR